MLKQIQNPLVSVTGQISKQTKVDVNTEGRLNDKRFLNLTKDKPTDAEMLRTISPDFRDLLTQYL